jgi:hypothetical protein
MLDLEKKFPAIHPVENEPVNGQYRDAVKSHQRIAKMDPQ